MKKIFYLLIVLLTGVVARAEKNAPAFIPQPESVILKEGNFILTPETGVIIPKKYAGDFAPYLSKKMNNDTGLELEVKTGNRTPYSNFILFEVVKDENISDEGYVLEVSQDNIVVKAKDYPGLFYGLQTLRQAMSLNAEKVEIPCMTVKDNPRFAWRGMMLDVSRHFQTKEFVKKQIDVFASYKINKFHWHLTDDQGWRIEIKKYPNLTEKGAWRADRTGITWWQRELATPDEPKTVGGFYTQEDIKEVIEYARIRNVEVIPEIDVPGHSKALIASYPFLSCVDSANFEVATGGKAPDNAVCAGKETSYEFLDDVLTEVAALFPTQYLHIGGDECNKTNWRKCEHCQKVVEENGLKDMEELQSHFIQRVNKLVSAKGKTMIGWDEILSGKGAKGATIMAWRRGKYTPEVDAPKGGYPTIMTDYTHSYISQVQGPQELEPEGPKVVLPLSKVYAYEPIPEELSTKEAAFVLGTEACLWGEFTPTEEHCEYMLYPRTLANAEVAWSRPEVKDWSRFQAAVENHFGRLEKKGVNVSTSLYSVYGSFALDKLSYTAKVYLTTETAYDICYTTDGSEPSVEAIKYKGVFNAENRSTVKAGLFNKDGKLLGKITELKIR
ncbi:beta-N-acetylhexosaminidase [Draconibacterium sp.]|uniref:beta-N-acetylhexosaminidase n=1 Tax=Draconibacterium sp. TaxID=1965318 RepID=UPI003564869A